MTLEADSRIPDADSVFAVVGGGRWARVVVSVVAGMALPFGKVVVVSRFNAERIGRLLRELPIPRNTLFETVPTLDDLLANYDVQAGVVVNSPRIHFETASRLIDAGVHVLIEKPVVMSAVNARELLDKAADRRVCLVPGLQYRFCSYLHAAAVRIADFSGGPSGFSLEWADPRDEVRYGEKKAYDPTINVAEDVMPHVWTILSTTFRQDLVEVDSHQAPDRPGMAGFMVRAGGVPGSVVLQRDAPARRRVLRARSNDGEDLSLDFSVEPGILSSCGERVSGDPDWETQPRPLERQLTYFTNAMITGFTADSDAAACMESARFMEEASILMRRDRNPCGPPEST